MILLDENIPEDQCQLLRKWRIRIRQIGQDVGRRGMKDEEHILPLLHELDRPTLFTRDLGFFDQARCHAGYCLVCLDVSRKEAAHFVRRLLRHPLFNTKSKRMGAVIRLGSVGFTVWRSNASEAERIPWKQ